MKKLFVVWVIAFLGKVISLEASSLEGKEETIPHNSKASTIQLPSKISAEDLTFICNNSSEHPLIYCSLKGFPTLQFSWGGYTSPVGLLNKLPIAYLELSSPVCNSSNIGLVEKNGQLTFNIFFDVFLEEGGKIISGFEKYQRSFTVKLRGIISDPSIHLSKM